MADKQLTISIVTPSGIHSKHQADVLMAETAEGQIGILPDHTPIISKLKHGELIINDGHKITFLATGNGILEVNGTQVTILVSSADRVEDLDEKKILAAKQQAEQIMAKQQKSDIDYTIVEANLRKSLNQLKSVKKWQKTKGKYNRD